MGQKIVKQKHKQKDGEFDDGQTPYSTFMYVFSTKFTNTK